MYGDYSRLTFSPSNRYSAVWAQQGRVQLDADLNEQTAIVLNYLRTLTTDLIGPFGCSALQNGFQVSVSSEAAHQLVLGAGYYYVYGLRCEASSDGLPHTVPSLELPEPPFVVELLVSETTVSEIQNPWLAEPALGPGVTDTTRRSQIQWTPRCHRHLPGVDAPMSGKEQASEVRDLYVAHNDKPRVMPLLRARVAGPPGAADDPATIPAGSAYRGVENQLYRIEVHTPGEAGTATFKWSRDNGSVELALESLSTPGADGAVTAQLFQPGRDRLEDLQPGDWVEYVDDRWAPAGKPRSLLQVLRADHATGRVELTGETGSTEFFAQLHPFLRRWDQKPRSLAPDNALALVEAGVDGEGEWIHLEDGVEVQFLAVGGRYERGDYWHVPVRVALGALWPTEGGGPAALPPHGPQRYLAPLAIVNALDPPDVVDVRVTFIGLGVDLLSGDAGAGDGEPAPPVGPADGGNA